MDIPMKDFRGTGVAVVRVGLLELLTIVLRLIIRELSTYALFVITLYIVSRQAISIVDVGKYSQSFFS